MSALPARIVPTVRTVRGDNVYTLERSGRAVGAIAPIANENNEAISRLGIALRRNDSHGVAQAIDMLAGTLSGTSILVTLTKACAVHAIRSMGIGR